MLDLEVVTPPFQDGLDIVSLAEMKQHLRIMHSRLDDTICSAVIEAADSLHGRDGLLNRTVFPMTWRRYLSAFPVESGPIQLPYPPLVSVSAVAYESGESPSPLVDPANYSVDNGSLVGSVNLLSGMTWPTVTENPRIVSVTFRAGFTAYPPKLVRLVKILAASSLDLPEATTDRPSRATEFGVEFLMNLLRVPVSYSDDDWA